MSDIVAAKPGATGTGVKKRNQVWQRIIKYKYIYLILLPGMAYFLIFCYGPLYGIQLAFKDFSISKGIWGSEWIGYEKFTMLFENMEFWSALRNTLEISILKIGFGFPVPIILAILINELRKGAYKRVIQTVFTFPHFLSWIIISGIMLNLLGNDGVINNILYAFGREKVGFLVDSGIFRTLLIFTEIWKESGWSCIMYLAAISGIDSGLYESAIIDGANRWHKARYITLPGISGMAVILLVLSLGNMMNANFDQVFNMYNPAVYSTSDIIDTYIYRITFLMKPDYGFSTAVGLFKGIVNLILLLLANSVVKRLNGLSIA